MVNITSRFSLWQLSSPLLNSSQSLWILDVLAIAISTWPDYLTLSQAECGMIFLPVLAYWLYSGFFFALSWKGWTSQQLHTTNVSTTNSSSKKRKSNSPSTSKVIRSVLQQHLLQCIIAYLLVLATRESDPAVMAAKLESWPVVIGKLIAAALILDTYQYWLHRLMHMNHYLYKNFHSVHHQLLEPFAFGALYNHPVEGLLLDTIGGGLPSIILDMHPWTSCLFYTIATLKTVDDHCGFAFPYDPFQMLFPNNARYHDIHHQRKGIKFNFSQPFFTFWDSWMGTQWHEKEA